MVSNVNGASVASTYVNNANTDKNSQKSDLQKAEAGISSQGDTSKIEQIKSDIESGQYKINLEKLSQKIADELL